MYSKILVPLDGSITAERALPCARCFAAKLKTPVELLAVVDIGEIAMTIASEKARFLDTMIGEAVRQLTEYLRGIAASFVDGNVSCSVEKGKPEDLIIERAAAGKSILIAMASHGRSGLNRFLLGSVAEKVLRGTSNPLLLIRATSENTSAREASFDSVVVPLDGSDLAERVLPTIVEMAKGFDVDVKLFRAYHIPYSVYGDGWGVAEGLDELLATVRDEAEDYLNKKAEELKKLGVTKVACIIKEGFAADEIIKFGRSTADSLIAMGSHGRSGMKRWVMGSVAEAVVRHSAVPVLVVRAT